MSDLKPVPPNCQSCRVRVASHKVPASKGVFRWKCETCFKRLAPSGFKKIFQQPSEGKMTEVHMMVRNTDPDTSREAAESFTPVEMEALVLDAIAKFPNGCIADDIEAMFPHIRSHSITPRFAPLLRNGCIVDTGERRVAKSRRGQRVVKFVPESDRVVPTPKKKKGWVGLTEDEVQDFQVNKFVSANLIRAIERRLQEKNSGL